MKANYRGKFFLFRAANRLFRTVSAENSQRQRVRLNLCDLVHLMHLTLGRNFRLRGNSPAKYRLFSVDLLQTTLLYFQV